MLRSSEARKIGEELRNLKENIPNLTSLSEESIANNLIRISSINLEQLCDVNQLLLS